MSKITVIQSTQGTKSYTLSEGEEITISTLTGFENYDRVSNE